jgi:hypothetical protein
LKQWRITIHARKRRLELRMDPGSQADTPVMTLCISDGVE